MDRTHFLVAQSTTRTDRERRDPRATACEIDAFYEDHGHDLFLHLYRLRGAARALATRFTQRAERKRGFAPAPSGR
ncbi:MAG: hypothetical protein KDK28_13190 [Maritimibacter sp.]|nr:hypothetical protein [Maritimibacter sp.]